MEEKKNGSRRFYQRDRPELWADKLIEWLCFHTGNPKKVLDLGCGRGEKLVAFKKRGCDAYGIDNSNYFISICISKGLSVRNVNIENKKFPFKDNIFDLVMSDNVIEHISSPHNMMSETRRVLKPGGFVVIQTPNWKHSMKIFFDCIGHVKPYSDIVIDGLLNTYKFTSIRIWARFGHLKYLWRYFGWAWGKGWFHPFKRHHQMLAIAQKQQEK